MEDIISVIIPVYNVEQYLPQCMDSVLGQSYPALEIILADDGSKDQSGILCDRYADSDSRVKVIHQENQGAASARNAALRVASGTFLAFLDSDDYLWPRAYEYLYKKLKAYDADVVQGSFYDVFRTYTSKNIVLEEECLFSTEEYLRRYTIDWTCGLLWNKLFRRELFTNIFFEEGHIVDDDFFTYQGMMNAKKILNTPEAIYYYRKRKSGVTNLPENRIRTIYDRLDYLQKRRREIAGRYPKLKKDFDLHYLQMLIWLSEDEFATVEVVDSIKVLLNDFLQKNKCRIPFHMKKRLHSFQRSSAENWLNHKRVYSDTIEISEYYD